MDWLVVVILVPILVEAEQGILQYLIDGCLASSSWTDTHQPMTDQLSLIQLDHLTYL